MDSEPTLDTLAWICKNAEQAWLEGDPKKLQFWEDQKKIFQEKCYQKIESLQKQISMLQTQQELLIQKIANREYTPEEANQLNRQIYKHKEELVEQVQFYKKLAECKPSSFQTQPLSFSPDTLPASENPVQFSQTIPLSEYISQLSKNALRRIFLTNTGQIFLCFILLLIAVYLTWTWNTRNQKPKFEIHHNTSQDMLIIKYSNQGMFLSKLHIGTPKNWEFKLYQYIVNCYIELSEEKKTPIDIPTRCFYSNEAILSPLPTTSIEVQPGSEKELALDLQCIKRTFTEAKNLIIIIKTLYLHKPVLQYKISLEQTLTKEN